MTEIIYNDDFKEIQFSGKITSFIFYNQFFEALNIHYKLNGSNCIPTFSFECVEHFDATVVPNLIGIGLIINKIHGGEKKIPLKFARISSTKFLDNAGFFDNVGKEKNYSEIINIGGYKNEVIKKQGLNLYDFDPRLLGFYNNQHTQKQFNNEHKVHIYNDSSYEYYKLFSDPDISKDNLDTFLNSVRTNKFNELKPFVEKHYYNILYREKRTENEVKIILNVLSELICNSILYSGSLCAAMLQSKNNKTLISVSDFGVGFEYSFNLKPNFEYLVLKSYGKIENNNLKKYLLIFEALNYSKNKNRANLFTLLRYVINNGGKMRIHYDTTQVVFTSNRCNKCEDIEPIKCSSCLLNNKSDDQLISPVRFFKDIFQGVHIEVELNF